MRRPVLISFAEREARNLLVLAKTLLVVPAMILSTACNPAGGPGTSDVNTAAGGPSTEWKEGYGGDTQAIDVVRQIEGVCFRAKRLRGSVLNSAMEAIGRNGQPVDVVAGLCKLMEQGELRVEMVDQPVVKGEPKDMANYPYEKPRRLEVKRSYWSDKTIPSDKREALLLHELIPLIGLDDVDYVRSARLLVALNGVENRVLIEACDEKRIEAVYSSGNPDILRHYTNHLGFKLCEPAVAVMKRHASSKVFGEELTREMYHHYAWGIFGRIVKAASQDEIAEALGYMQKTFSVLEESLGEWTPDTCKDIGEVRAGHFRCGSMVHVVAGASPRLKYRLAKFPGSMGFSEFDRAAIMFMEMLDIRRKTLGTVEGNPLFSESGNLSQSVIQSAIEAQNWTLLMYLGQMQRRLNPTSPASAVLLKGMDFAAVKRNTVGDEINDEYVYPLIGQVGRCMDVEIKNYVSAILDGLRTDFLVCGTTDVI
jgi:hypothetical protein